MMMTTNFSEIKKQGRNTDFKIWGDKSFWPEYLQMLTCVICLRVCSDDSDHRKT